MKNFVTPSNCKMHTHFPAKLHVLYARDTALIVLKWTVMMANSKHWWEVRVLYCHSSLSTTCWINGPMSPELVRTQQTNAKANLRQSAHTHLLSQLNSLPHLY